MATVTKEEAFAELIRPYENLWIAIIEKDEIEYVVGHGSKAGEAAKEAASKGYSETTLFRVPSFKSRWL